MHPLKAISAVIIILISAAIYWISLPGESFSPGGYFESELAWEKFIDKNDFYKLGKFNPGWPAEVVTVNDAKDEISLSIPGYGQHSYPGFTGYSLRSVLLKRKDGAYSGYVLRRKEKY